MDVLDDILASLRLTGGVVVDARMRGDWCLISQFTPEHCAAYFPVPGTVIAYHYVRSGQLWAEVEGHPPVRLRQGSVLIMPRNDPHRLYSQPGLPPVDADLLLQPGRNGGPATIEIDGSGEEVELFCGFLGVAEYKHPLIDALPPMLVLDPDQADHEWVASSMRFLSSNQSPETVARLAESFLSHAVRQYLERAGGVAKGWLAGLRDPAVSKALSIIHTRYADELDVEGLAREAGVSRTILGERFGELIGEPPMRYCARWRMRTAANMLRDGKQSTANIAYSVGFNSEAAFNRAFKREFGVPPATWRRQIEAEEQARMRKAEPHALPPQQVRYCTASDGTRLAYSVTGEGPPIVKTANWLNHIEHDWDSPLWRHWISEFTRGRSLIRYDERGNGLSDWDTPELSFEAFVDDLECVVDCLGLEQFDLLAISQGAAVAIAYAVRHPGRVRHLIICNGYAAGWAARADPTELARREAMLTLTEFGWGADNPAYRQLFTNHYIPDATPKQMGWFNEMQRLSASPENALKLQRVLAAIDVHELLPKVRTPTLIFHSRNDQAVPFSQGEELAARIPGARFIPLESKDHILLESEPAWAMFSEISREFLDRSAAALPGADPPPPTAVDEIRSCTAKDGARIAYAASGEGFPLVKAPNWITNLETDRSNPSYRHWIAECSKISRFVRSDMRGFGKSELDPPEFTFEALVGDFGAVIDDLGVETCDLLGVAHGAPLAIAYAARNPHRVRKLVLVNSFAAGWRVRQDPEEIAWRMSLMEMNQREWAFRRSLLGEMFLTLYFPTADQELIDWHNRHFDEFGPTERLQAMIELAADIDVRKELSNVRAETLVCHSKQDGNAPLSAGRAVADGIAGAKFVELDSVNHILLGNEPAWPVFVREMRAFLKEIPSPAGRG
jgi:pimeloyl-ACP methyl ester carboxylesterase/AraC-like DNA-binding protein